jgi:hypothetical protein
MVEKEDTAINEKSSSTEKVGKKKEEKKEVHFCKDCKGYDKSTQREFHRKVEKKDEKGNRTEIVEVRAICRNPKADSYKHLVMAEYAKRQCPCWEKGEYITAKLDEKKTEKPRKKQQRSKQQISEEKMTTPEEYFGSTEDHLKRLQNKKNNS